MGRAAGKYTLERVIGSGGMATVYEASHRNGHRVAVKMLKPALAVGSEVRERFLREGYAANKVRHAGAVRVLDDDVTDDGLVFLVMELLEGWTLDALASQSDGGKLPVKLALQVGKQLLAVLEAAHRAGIVHRDIKPENVFVQRNGELKVLDFGIARFLDPRDAMAPARDACSARRRSCRRSRPMVGERRSTLGATSGPPARRSSRPSQAASCTSPTRRRRR